MPVLPPPLPEGQQLDFLAGIRHGFSVWPRHWAVVFISAWSFLLHRVPLLYAGSSPSTPPLGDFSLAPFPFVPLPVLVLSRFPEPHRPLLPSQVSGSTSAVSCLGDEGGLLSALSGHDRGLSEVKGTFLPSLVKIRGAC